MFIVVESGFDVICDDGEWCVEIVFVIVFVIGVIMFICLVRVLRGVELGMSVVVGVLVCDLGVLFLVLYVVDVELVKCISVYLEKCVGNILGKVGGRIRVLDGDMLIYV